LASTGASRADVDTRHIGIGQSAGGSSCSPTTRILHLGRRVTIAAAWERRNVAESEVRTLDLDPGRHGRAGDRPGLWTLEETADWLAVTERMVRRLVAERRIPYVKVGRYVRFRPEDVEAWRDGNVHPAVVIQRPRLVG
jgi:excisionase family DNA binding protein